LILRHRFEPADNLRLAHLCGPLDANLRDIEAALAVRIQRRGGAFSVEGPRQPAERALALIVSLHERAQASLGGELLQLALAEARTALAGGAAGASPSAPQQAAVASAPDTAPSSAADVVLHTRRSDLRGRTPNQVQYLRQILATDITFGIGPAGTGKTFLAVACAVDALERQGVQRIVLTRPAVEAGERLGFLPGDLAQKVDPYLRPLYDALYDLMGYDRVTRAFERGQLEIAPLAFMRGRTLNHAFVILDEAQNTTREQMKMFLTRMGFGAKCVVTGDVSQVDLPAGVLSGLVDAAAVLEDVRGIAFTRFTAADVVRHPLVARIVEAYDAAQQAPREAGYLPGPGRTGRRTRPAVP
jgi:phosphate starvation-inducible PhoH-like protein